MNIFEKGVLYAPHEAIRKKRKVVAFFVFALLSLNLGLTDYLSAPILCMLAMLASIHASRRFPIPRNFIILLAVGIGFSLIPIGLLLIKYNEFHSSLSQLRELTFLVLIVYVSRYFTAADQEIGIAFDVTIKIIFAVVLIQFIQTHIGATIFMLPQNWMMLNYGNSLQTAIESGYDYTRPVGFYSEPSVVASVVLPAFYIAVKKARKLTALFCILTLLITGSMLGVVGSILIVIFASARNRAFKVTIAIILFFSFANFYSNRATAIINGEDMSYMWRIQFPIEYVINKFSASEFLPVPVSQIFEYAKNHFDGASISDTWPIFTMARLGIFGILWIGIVGFFLPKKLRVFFIFLAIVSGAPLYQDKALLMILYYRAAYGKNPV